MTRKPLGLGQGDRRRTQPRQCGRAVFLHGDDLEEVEDAQPAANPGEAASGQGMVRSGDVVPHGLGRVRPDEHRVGRSIHAEMLRRQSIGDHPRLLARSGKKDEAMLAQGLPCSGIRLHPRFQLGYHAFGESGLRRDEDRERLWIMLRLGNQLRGDVGGIAGIAGDHDLRRSREHVDGAVEGDQSLGRGHVEIAGADDLVHPLDALCAIGQRGNRLGTADAVEVLDPEQMRGGQGFRRGFG